MQAIETRWLGPTDTKSNRISARCDAGRIILPWDNSLNQELNHRAAARTLAIKLGWLGTWASGSVPSLPNSYVHCNVRRVEEGWNGPYETWDVWQAV